jgi:hypothetical protein
VVQKMLVVSANDLGAISTWSDRGPTGALARFAGIAYEHEKEVQTVTGSIHHAVRSPADHVAEDCEKLKEDGGRVP